MPIPRRTFLAAAAAAPATAGSNGRLAVLGGDPVRRDSFPSWPVADTTEEKALLGVLRSGKWGRLGGKAVETFEQKYAALTGAKHVLATANGTSALFTALNALEVGPGDEVLVPPYTFVATINVVLLNYALPVFVDTDIETFQMDARESRVAHHGSHCADDARAYGWTAPRTWTRSSPPPRQAQASRCSKTPARRTWASGAIKSSERRARPAASVFRLRRISTRARAALSLPTTTV